MSSAQALEHNSQQNWKPKRWLAAVLSLLLGYSGMLYIGKLGWFLFYLTSPVLLSVLIYLLVSGIPLFYLLNVFGLITWIFSIGCAVHTFKLSKFDTERRPWYSHWWGILGIYLLIVIIPILTLRTFFFEQFHLSANSMAPNFVKGDHVVISKFGYGNYGTYGFELFRATPSKTIERGDVVVFSYPPDPSIDYIKRVIGLPGDLIKYRNKMLIINDKRLGIESFASQYEIRVNESYGDKTWQVMLAPDTQAIDFEVVVPEGHYFVMGDNRDNSRDSRAWGFVPARNIKGKVIYAESAYE
jgi:signal peptidase I